jgi:hypothetical protein
MFSKSSPFITSESSAREKANKFFAIQKQFCFFLSGRREQLNGGGGIAARALAVSLFPSKWRETEGKRGKSTHTRLVS